MIRRRDWVGERRRLERAIQEAKDRFIDEVIEGATVERAGQRLAETVKAITAQMVQLIAAEHADCILRRANIR